MADMNAIVGNRYGKLQVIEYRGVLNFGKEKRSCYLCQCDCGKQVIVPRRQLLSGRSKTCGDCSHIETEHGHMRYYCSSGGSFVFDADDYSTVIAHQWYIDTYGYPATKINAETKRLSRMLMGCDEGIFVDHVNGDTLDNRRFNLRIATKQENQRNMAIPSHNSSGYKGVGFRKDRGRYRAYISLNDKTKHLGYFDTPEEAARAYDEAARFYFGKFACVNFPRPGEQGCRRNQPAEEERIAV